jgi:Na+-driven multidrug efflux pump
VLSQIISAILVLIVLMRLPKEQKLEFSSLQLNKNYLGRILQIGIPAGLQFITFDLANVLIQSSVNSFGDVTIAAWTAIGKTDSINWMICGAFGVAITTFVGQNFGAQKYARVRKSVWVCMGMGIPVVAAVSAIILPLRSFILGIYTDDLAVISAGAYIMLFTVPFNAIFIPVEVFAGTMRGVGSSLTPTIITGTCVCLFRVLWMLLLVSRFHTIEMLSICYPISWALAGIVFLIVYFRGNWMKRRILECGMEPET